MFKFHHSKLFSKRINKKTTCNQNRLKVWHKVNCVGSTNLQRSKFQKFRLARFPSSRFWEFWFVLAFSIFSDCLISCLWYCYFIISCLISCLWYCYFIISCVISCLWYCYFIESLVTKISGMIQLNWGIWSDARLCLSFANLHLNYPVDVLWLLWGVCFQLCQCIENVEFEW